MTVVEILTKKCLFQQRDLIVRCGISLKLSKCEQHDEENC